MAWKGCMCFEKGEWECDIDRMSWVMGSMGWVINIVIIESRGWVDINGQMYVQTQANHSPSFICCALLRRSCNPAGEFSGSSVKRFSLASSRSSRTVFTTFWICRVPANRFLSPALVTQYLIDKQKDEIKFKVDEIQRGDMKCKNQKGKILYGSLVLFPTKEVRVK